MRGSSFTNGFCELTLDLGPFLRIEWGYRGMFSKFFSSVSLLLSSNTSLQLVDFSGDDCRDGLMSKLSPLVNCASVCYIEKTDSNYASISNVIHVYKLESLF